MLLQHKLNVKLSQRQILTPGLVQMVSVLALNKLELKDMINAEMVENPVLEELEDAVPMLDDVGRQEEERDRLAAKATTTEEGPPTLADEKKDPFEEIDFGSFFQDYLDPGYRSSGEMEEIEKPSFENFLSKPGNLSDHLLWQLGAISVRPPVHEAAELIIGNLNEEGYLIASDEELLGVVPVAPPEADVEVAAKIVGEAEALGLAVAEISPETTDHGIADLEASVLAPEDIAPVGGVLSQFAAKDAGAESLVESDAGPGVESDIAPEMAAEVPLPSAASHGNTATGAATAPARIPAVTFSVGDLHEALEVVRQFDPPGIACRDLRECLLYQLRYHLAQLQLHRNGNGLTEQVVNDAIAIVDQHLKAVTLKQFKEIGRAIGRTVEAVQAALDYVRTLDPRPGLRYNKVPARLIEPDVAFVKHGDEWLVIMNDEDMPQLRLNPAYKRLLTRDGNDRDTRNYVKDRYKSAIQLIKNIEQRKQTITKVCYSIVARQQDFLERGIDHLKPMMIKEVAEEIGVHPSTVSRAVANKYVHTQQGVFELRYFFSESVQGPEGGGTSLLILKRRVKKLIEEEDPSRPLTDEQITRILQSQGIQVTRRTVAKYREDMKIPSTHQRRVKK
ncbi:MAG TPA: RNA polymerase factor sigma-54 [Terriglobales bacterium]|nr:RNA polymerase factor sigma-54 [Terriglobales bacterium]